jgi:hypothetical protein
MDPKVPAGSTWKEVKGNELFSNTKVEVTDLHSKKEMEARKGGERNKVTNEEKNQRMAGSWRSKLPSAQGKNIGDEEKLMSHNFSSTLKTPSNGLPQVGDIAINERNHDATAHNQNEAPSSDRASVSIKNGSDNKDTDTFPLLPSEIFTDWPEDPMIPPSEEERESEELLDYFYRFESECDAFLEGVFPKESLLANSAPELEQDGTEDNSFTPQKSAMRKLSTASEPLPRCRYSADCEVTGEHAHKQTEKKNEMFEVQSHSQTPPLSPTTPHRPQTHVEPGASVPQPLQTHKMYGNPIAAA